ncbi:MAG: PEP-CTERM sorting domain-containing protein [Verrucomicrobiales bacterium]|nr:PEP-CTERM sorting domain-containing protein [Verrucomicrobiales bacterium]
MKPILSPVSFGLRAVACIAFAGGCFAIRSQAAVFLDVTSLTPGPAGVGTFSGTLGGVTVTGTISSLGGPPAFGFTPVGPGSGSSTLDGTSPQFSYSPVFSPAEPATDRVGWTYMSVAGNLVTISFSAPVTDPVFHVASMSGVGFHFGPTPGFTSLTLLGGNHGAGDGVDPAFGGGAYSFAMIWDLIPPTTDATPPGMPPPVAGDRSAYASVRINGTFSSLAFITDGMGFGDDGSFTLSLVPEPSAMLLMLGGMALCGCFSRRRNGA